MARRPGFVLPLCFGAALLCAPLLASAQNINWTYFDFGISYIDVDNFDDGEDFGMKMSVGFAENWHLYVDVDRAEIETGGLEFDYRELFVAAGYNWGMSDSTDLLVRLGGFEAKANMPGSTSVSEDGVGVEFGLRSAFSDKFQGGARLRYVDLDNIDEASVLFDGQYAFADNWAFTGEVQIGEETNSLFLGVRLNLD